MALINRQIEKTFRNYPFGSQEGKGRDAKVLVKYFNPCGRGTWLITEAEEQEDGSWLLFGYCHITDWEWGYVSLTELMEITLPWGLKIERDLHTGGFDTVRDFIEGE